LADYVVNQIASLRGVIEDNERLRRNGELSEKARARLDLDLSSVRTRVDHLHDVNATMRIALSVEQERSALLEKRCDELTDVTRGLRAALKDAVLTEKE
jgi:hypothetical protein